MSTNQDNVVIARIHRLLDGREWSADTCQEIAEILTDAGWPVRDIEDLEDVENEEG